MHSYTENDAFPAAISLIDDSDPPNGANFGTPSEGLADRTIYLARRLLPSGLTAFGAGLSTPADLTTLTGMVNKDIRVIDGYGSFIYSSTATTPADGAYVVNGNGGVGRWRLLDHAQQLPRILQQEVKTTQTATTMTSHGGSFLDPGNRDNTFPATIGYPIITSSIFQGHIGDEFAISYSIPFWGPDQTGPAFADPIFAVGLKAESGGVGVGTCDYFDALLDNSASINVDQVVGGRGNGIAYVVPNGVDGPVRVNSSRSANISWSANGPVIFYLVAAPFSYATFPTQVIPQGATLSITQYRQVIV